MEGFLRQAGQIQDELARLETQHKGLARHPGKPFDWAGHRKHRVELAALKSRILKFREKQGIPPRNAVTIVGAADKPAALQNERTNERTNEMLAVQKRLQQETGTRAKNQVVARSSGRYRGPSNVTG